MKMILVRHGETEWNKTGRVQGASDVGLSGTGKEQISRLALVLKEEKLDAIYASPLKRTRETALILGRFHEAEIRLESGLMEMNHGDFEGLFFRELREKHASFLKRWASDPSSVRMPNGETLAELQDRAWKTVTQIVETCSSALVVSHNFTISSILCKINEVRLQDFRTVRVDLASKSIVHFRGDEAHVEIVNDVSHLLSAD